MDNSSQSLTAEEEKALRQRRELFPAVVEDIRPGIAELAASLEYVNPEQAAERPDEFLPVLEEFLTDADLSLLSPSQRLWLLTRITSFIIELLVRRHGGYLYLQSDPKSDFFLRYVIGGFTDGTDPSIIVDPAEVANHFLSEPPGRSLSRSINNLGLGPGKCVPDCSDANT